MTKPPFDFPITAEDGEEFFPNENDKNLGYTWVEDGQYWALIKQVPGLDVTKDYVDSQIQVLETEISNLTDIVQESVQVTASLEFLYVVDQPSVDKYKVAFASCNGAPQEDESEEDTITRCRLASSTEWLDYIVTAKGQFQTLESGSENESVNFSAVHLLDVAQEDINQNSVNWIGAGDSGAVTVGDYIQIVKVNNGAEDPANYGYYKIRSGTKRAQRGTIESNQGEYSIGLDFEHGKGSLSVNSTYKIRGIVSTGALTIEKADDKYVQLLNNNLQTISGPLNVSTVNTDSDDNAAATKKYVDDQQQSAVPIGTVVAFTGPASTIPDGWLLCGGEGFNSTKYPVLKKLFPNTTLPDFRGHFLVGYGADGYGTFLGKYEQSTALPKTAFKTNSYTHSHAVNDGVYVNRDNTNSNGGAQVNYTSSGYNQGTPSQMATDINNHVHDVNVGGDTHTRPNSYAINWIIKAG